MGAYAMLVQNNLIADGQCKLLNEHSEHNVDLYEAADYPGGHTHTVVFHPPGQPATQTNVDT